jgi:hypothetical protein
MYRDWFEIVKLEILQVHGARAWLLYACFRGVDILRLGHCMLALLNKTGGD